MPGADERLREGVAERRDITAKKGGRQTTRERRECWKRKRKRKKRHRNKNKQKKRRKVKMATAGTSSSSSVPGPSISPMEAIALMQKGSTLLKCGRTGKPHFRTFTLEEDFHTLNWTSPIKNPKDSSGLFPFSFSDVSSSFFLRGGGSVRRANKTDEVKEKKKKQ